MPQENKLYLNIQEQVEKNKKDILDIQQGATVLADFGIKVIGQVDESSELPDPAEYEGEYGDAYAVGTEAPYDFYIFTRAFEGQDDPSWFNIGEFPVPGPQGEQGPAGQNGSNGRGISSIAKTSTSGLEDTYTITYTDGSTSTYVVKNGANGQAAAINSVTATVDSGTGTPSVEVSLGGTEQSRSFAFAFHNLRGAQGEQGEPGAFFILAGQVTNASLLPDASVVSANKAYLVGSSEPYDVYAIMVVNDVHQWINLGPVAVTVSDTKVALNSWSSSGTLPAEVLNELVNTTTADFVRIGTFFFAKKSTGRYFCADKDSGEVHVYTLDIDLSTGEWVISEDVMVDIDTAQTITGTKTFSGGIKLNPNTLLYSGPGSYQVQITGHIVPSGSNTYNIGSSSYKMKDFYLAGKINPNSSSYGLTLPDTTSWTADSQIVDSASAQTITGAKVLSNTTLIGGTTGGGIGWSIGRHILPETTNYANIGSSSKRVANIYVGGNLSDGTNSVTVADLAALITYAKTQGWIQ